MINSQVLQADSFVDSIGVNVHSSYGTADPTNTYNLDWMPLLTYLGVRHVREAFTPTGSARIAQQLAAQQLDSNGVDILYILDTPGLANNRTSLSILLASNVPYPGGIEPWNEYDIKPGFTSGTTTQWKTDIIAFQPELYAASKAKWPDVPVLTSAVSNNILTPPVGSLLPNADGVNIHLYGPPALTPEFSSIFAPSKLPAYSNQAISKPVWVTETGLISGTSIPSNLKTSELAAARLIPRMLLYCFAPLNITSISSAPAPVTRGGLGVFRTFLYELVDEHDSDNPALSDDDRYGLFKSDLSPKLVATTISNIITLLADSGVHFVPTPVTVTTSGPYEDKFEYLLFQKRDGSYWMVFWMGIDSVNDPIGISGNGSGIDLPDIAYNVTVLFNRAFQQTKLYRPLVGLDPIKQSGALSSVVLEARHDVQILKLSGHATLGTRARGMRSYYDSRLNSLG